MEQQQHVSTDFLAECVFCERTHEKAVKLRRAVRCKCGALFIPPPTKEELLQQRLLSDCECMARWAPYYQGSALDLQRSRRPVASDNRSEEEREQCEARLEQSRARARALFVKLERLRTEAAQAEGQELRRTVAVIDWLIERGGSERTKGYQVRGAVRAEKLSVLVGRAFADTKTKQRTDEGVTLAVEFHGAELLRDASWLWRAEQEGVR